MTAAPKTCNYKADTLHGFTVEKNCSCNNCDLACDPNQGFQYSEPSSIEDFNVPLVLGFYGFVVLVTGGLTYYRFRRDKNKQE